MAPPTTIPDEALADHTGWSVELAWEGERANTWRLTDATGDTRFIKVGWTTNYPTLADERARLDWCAGRIDVPRVVSYGSDDAIEWMVTSSLRGVDATVEKHSMPPERLVPLLGAGLRRWHDSLPVAECPFDFLLDTAIEHCARRVHDETTSWDGFRGRNDKLTPNQALAKLIDERPDDEDAVVCHGDYCFPNVFIEDGEITGYLDLGELGIADRWWDLAIGAWSVTWNVDPKHEPLFYEGYGIEPDEARIWYFRTLYELAA